MIPAQLLTTEYLFVIILFILAIFILYRLFKLVIKSVIIMIAAFAFPFVADYMGVPLPVPITIDTGIKFALLGLTLFSVYNFFSFITHLGKILLWPFKRKRR